MAEKRRGKIEEFCQVKYTHTMHNYPLILYVALCACVHSFRAGIGILCVINAYVHVYVCGGITVHVCNISSWVQWEPWR